MENGEKATIHPVSLVLGALSIVTACSIFFGFLVVNIYLAQFGFWDFNFLRVEYVIAGLLFMTTAAVPAWLWWFLYWTHNFLKMHLNIQDRVAKRVLLWILMALTSVMVIYAAYGFFLLIFSGGPSHNPLFNNLLALVWSVVVIVLYGGINKTYHRVKSLHIPSADFRDVAKRWIDLIRPVYYIPLFLATPFLFAMVMYPFIPRYWGGGAESAIVVYLKNNTNLASPVSAKLIYQSQDSLLISASSTTYLLPMDQVADIQYPKQGIGFQTVIDTLVK